MKKLLIINGHLNTGGVERSLVDVLQHIDYTKYEVDLLLLQGKGDYEEEIPPKVITHTYEISEAYGPLASTIAKNLLKGHWFYIIYRIIIQFLDLKFLPLIIPSLRNRYDAAIAYRPGICTDILADAVTSNNKISWWHHGEMNLSEREKDCLYVEYQNIQHIVAVSESSATLIKQNFPTAQDKVSVIPNMLCSDTIRRKALEKCQYSFHANSEKFRIVTVGRLSPEKNMKFCVEVAKTLKEQSVQFEWVLVGDGEEYNTINQEILELELEKELRLVGTLSNPYPLMLSADLLFHPSMVESQGLTILESMVIGTPVICVKSAGPSEFIKNGENGIMIEQDKVEATKAIITYINNPQLCTSISINARETIAQFNPEIVSKKIESLMK